MAKYWVEWLNDDEEEEIADISIIASGKGAKQWADTIII